MNATKKILTLREDEVFFHAVLKLELENNSNPTLINR